MIDGSPGFSPSQEITTTGFLSSTGYETDTGKSKLFACLFKNSTLGSENLHQRNQTTTIEFIYLKSIALYYCNN